MPETTLSKGIKYYDLGEDWDEGMKESLRRLNAYAREDFANDPETTTGLAYGYRRGIGWNGTVWALVAGATIALADDSVNYVERTAAGVVSVNQVGFDTAKMPMAVVTTVGGAITDIADWRGAKESSVGSSQPLDAELTAIAGLVSAADTFPFFTGSGAASLAALSAFARTLLDDADAATARATLAAMGSSGAGLTFSVPLVFDNAGSVLATGPRQPFSMPACTLTGWDLVGDQPGDLVIDLWKNTYANLLPTVADTIFGTKPALSGALKNQATGLAIAIAAGDWLRPNIDSVATITAATLMLHFTRT